MNPRMNYREILRIVRRNFGYMQGHRARFLAGGILALGSLAVSFLIPYMYEQFMRLIRANADDSEIFRVVGPVFAALLLLAPLVCMGGYWQKSSANAATANMQRAVFSHTMRMPLSSLETDRADKILRATANVNSAASLFTGYTMTIVFKFVIYFFGAFCILLIINWRYALIGAALSAVMFRGATVFNVRLRALEQKALSADSALGAVLLDMASNLPIVKLYCIRDVLKKKYADAGEEAYRNRLKYKVMRGATDGALDFMGYSSQALAILIGVWVIGPSNDFAALVYISSLFSLMLAGVRELGNAVMFIQTTIVNSQRVYGLLALPPEADGEALAHADAINPYAVRLSHVSFGYAPGKPVLRDLCLEVKTGQTVAIVGGSGCGKTTLIKLLERFYPPEEGEIWLGGARARDMSNAEIRAYFAYIPQDAQLFDGSIADNIALYAKAADARRIRECLQRAALDLSDQTQAGENGSKLSGGQARRVSIARALYKDAPVYLLDEATSALDGETESALQQTIDTVLKDKTVICVAHRLSTVRNADKIVYMEDGRILETGTHKELLARNGGYSRLCANTLR